MQQCLHNLSNVLYEKIVKINTRNFYQCRKKKHAETEHTKCKVQFCCKIKTSNKIIVRRTIAAVDDCMNYVIMSFYLEFTESLGHNITGILIIDHENE